MKKKLFINNDFTVSQLIWIIPIIDGFCVKNKISKIIFSTKLPSNIIHLKHVKIFLNKYSIEVIKYEPKFKKYLNTFLMLIKNFLFLKKIFLKSPLQNKNNWFDLQIDHSIWDYTNILMKDDNLNRNFVLRCFSILVCLDKIRLGNYLVYKKVTHAFIGHSVYSSRALMAVLRKNKIQIFNQANFNLYRQYHNEDKFWSEIKKESFNKLKDLNLLKLSNKYWKKRIIGKGNYKDSQLALYNVKRYKIKEKNFIFLHIFKDSPFNVIDKKRIFDDYFHWFIETIKIINHSDEKWYIKFHPSYKLWGENQKKIINFLLKKNNIILNKNITIQNKKLSNYDIFKNAKRVVTFSGTPHLEIASFGIKPIIISKSTLESYDKNKILKPKTLKHYEKLLLINSDSRVFKLNNIDKYIARKLLFIRENIFTLKEDLNLFNTYRSDNKNKINQEIKKAKETTVKNYNNLFLLGKNLNKLNRTISFNYMKYFL